MANDANDSVKDIQFFKTCYLKDGEVPVVTEFPSKIYYMNYVILLSLNILLTILTISLNSITILAYRKSAQLKSKKSYFLIMLLAVSNLLVGIFGNTNYVLVLIAIIIGYQRCPIYFVFKIITFCTSAANFLTLFEINIERYLAILHPFYHRTKVTKSKLLKIVMASWLFITIVRLSYLVIGEIINLICSATIIFIACFTLYIYVAIWITVRRRPREIEKRNAAERVSERRQIQLNELQNTKMAQSCAIVVVLTYICYTPYAVIISFVINPLVHLLSLWCITVGMCSASLNCLVFVWNNPILRREARKVFE